MKTRYTLKLKYFNDPGHGWIGVKRKLLEELGVLKQITHYSYQRGATVYLEEDCDAQVFLTAAKAAGYTLKIDYRHTDRSSPIRSYASFDATNVDERK